MGAHNQATLGIARQRAAYVATLVPDGYFKTLLTEAAESGTGGSLKRYAAEHEFSAVDTLQVTLRINNDGSMTVIGGWSPGPRELTTPRASYMRLADSRRDYAGVITLFHGETGYVGFDGFGDNLVLLAYYDVS